MVNDLWPTCAVCKLPVERMESYVDPITRETVWVASCHGATERTALTDTLLESCDKFVGGVAFTAPMLLEGVK